MRVDGGNNWKIISITSVGNCSKGDTWCCLSHCCSSNPFNRVTALSGIIGSIGSVKS